MSTNFYWLRDGEPGAHIGKRVGLSASVQQFIWAEDPVRTLFALFYSSAQAMSEYGQPYGSALMLKAIMQCEQQDYSSIGQEFS